VQGVRDKVAKCQFEVCCSVLQHCCSTVNGGVTVKGGRVSVARRHVCKKKSVRYIRIHIKIKSCKAGALRWLNIRFRSTCI